MSYAISPALPSGLSFDQSTGVVSGTPAAAQAVTAYTVTATGATFGSAVAQITIVVTPSLAPASAQVAAVAGAQITATSTLTGTGFTGAVTYTVAPSLPAGLTLNPSTGVVSGTPTAAQAQGTYTITGTDTSGFTATGVVFIQVNAALTPASQSVTVTSGQTMAATTALTGVGFSSGHALSYTVAPSLPSGVTLDAATGVLSGTPVSARAQTYTITGTDGVFTATASITLTVNATLTPNAVTVHAVTGAPVTATTAFTPAGFTGQVSYAVSPTLPAGVTLNTSTGVVTGTAVLAQPATSYIITGTDTSGTTATAALTIRIDPVLAPAVTTLSLTAGEQMTPTTALTATGFTGAVTYTVTPTLPSGLSLNAGTGIVSGTPQAALAATTYTITGTGATFGTATGSVTITISPRLSGGTDQIQGVVGTAIIPSTQIATTGFTSTVTFTTTQQLPAGLTLSPATGIISGTPTVITARTVYTITASDGTNTATILEPVTIVGAPPTAPAHASTYSNPTARTVQILWQGANPGSATSVKYTVTTSTGTATCTSYGSYCTLTGLSLGIPYTFAITATSQYGTSPTRWAGPTTLTGN